MKTSEHNNFGILRLLLATLVVLGHAKALTEPEPVLPMFSYVDYRVDAFFVISGYLVYGSYDRFQSLGSFYIRRFFRIYPLYLVVILAQAFAMVWVAGGLAQNAGELPRYLGFNLVMANFLAPALGGVLDGLHNPGINPSLWTLKIEMAFYIILPLLWHATRRWGMWFLAGLYVASTIFTIVALAHDADTLAKQLPGQLRLFAAGMLMYRYGGRLSAVPAWAYAGGGLLLFWLCTRYPSAVMLSLYPLAIGALVYVCALRLPVLPLKSDISYGVYLLHGPLIQFGLIFGLFAYSLWHVAALVALVYALAFITERAIERPGIELGKKLSARWVRRYPIVRENAA